MEAGTHYLRNRYYQPRNGRFTQADPYWHTGNMVYGDDPLQLNEYTYKPDIHAIMQSGNLYVYGLNNPLMWADPTGRFIIAILPHLTSFNYNRESAVEYARQWQEPNRNPDYPAYGSNCANFVSQSLVAGGMPTGGAWGIYWFFGTRTTREWHNASRQYQFFSDPFNGFVNNTYSVDKGGINNLAQSGNVKPGDLIYFSNSNSSSIYHAAMIVRVEGGEIYYMHNSGPVGERQASQVSANMFIISLNDLVKSWRW